MSFQVPKDRIFDKSTIIEENKNKVKALANEKVKGTSFDFNGLRMKCSTLTLFFQPNIYAISNF